MRERKRPSDAGEPPADRPTDGENPTDRTVRPGDGASLTCGERAAAGRRPLITIVAPVPPPYAGPEVCTQLLLNSPVAEAFQLLHVRANVQSSNATKGTFSWFALLRQILVYVRLCSARLKGSLGLEPIHIFDHKIIS